MRRIIKARDDPRNFHGYLHSSLRAACVPFKLLAKIRTFGDIDMTACNRPSTGSYHDSLCKLLFFSGTTKSDHTSIRHAFEL